MRRSISALLALSALSVSAVAVAQSQYASPSSDSSYTQSQPAPIERQYAAGGDNRPAPYAGQQRAAGNSVSPVAGVRVLSDEPLTTTANGGTVEVHLMHGRANISVDHPAANTLILVDLPNGQASLISDGFYTFNAGTGRLVVLHGEAKVFAAGAPPNAKGRSVREGEEATLNGTPDVGWATQEQIRADLVPMNAGPQYAGNPQGRGEPGYGAPPPNAYDGRGYDDEGYGDYAYGYPAYGYYGGYGYGYPWGWDYAWGYPYGFGLGFGWGGGFYGGYRGGYSGGFRGGYGGGYRGGYGGGGFHGGAAGGGFHGGGGHR